MSVTSPQCHGHRGGRGEGLPQSSELTGWAGDHVGRSCRQRKGSNQFPFLTPSLISSLLSARNVPTLGSPQDPGTGQALRELAAQEGVEGETVMMG